MKRPELLFGQSPSVARVLALCTQFASGDQPLLILGERGAGKTELARYIHTLSSRTGAFIEDSAASHTNEMALADLCGYRRGAFTGAVEESMGLLEAANRGTYFMDELDSASLSVQALLLKLLETGSIRRLGEVRSRDIAVRFVGACNANPEKLVSTGQLRQDLLDRFGYSIISVPSLAQRRDEILFLAQHFLQGEAQRASITPVPELAPEVAQVFLEAPWRGNIRELKLLCEYLVRHAAGARWIEVTDLPPQFVATLDKHDRPSGPSVEQIERSLMQTGGNREAAARSLGISARHLYRLLGRARREAS